jgi:hypothetical protein
VFPDDSTALRQFVEVERIDDNVIIDRLRQVFDRPAFQTPFHQESSLPAFRQAIGDTIQALNTGIWQTRDGKEIERLPSRHQLSSQRLRDVLAVVVKELIDLRARFEQLIREGEIRPCSCGKPDCPVFLLSSRAIDEMDTLRATIIDRIRHLPTNVERVRPVLSQAVSVTNSYNSGIIANKVTIRGRDRPGPIIIPALSALIRGNIIILNT